MSFADRLHAYKTAIDADIAEYAKNIRDVTTAQHGAYAALSTDIYLDVLGRGGKRIRGSLVLCGYEMSGGTDRTMIMHAARAIEMLHAYMLIVDDVQDRSLLRRGKPTAHELFAEHHRTHGLKGDAAHAGMSLALNAALVGDHAAQMILANLGADAQLRLNALSIVNRTMLITCHGQTADMMNELSLRPTSSDIDRVLEMKTALYSFINPLHVGMVLAGAGCEYTDAITPYALHLGKAFQITDDILGIFGNEERLGKSPMDDIREGKATVLSVYALDHTTGKEREFLDACLGNASLTPQDFARCRDIVQKSGARNHATAYATREITAALEALDAVHNKWPAADVAFLRDLAMTIKNRQA